MGQSTEELSSEIAGTRRSLASDLDALQDRVSPSAMVERRKAAARGSFHSMRRRVMGSVQDVRDNATGTAQSAVHATTGSAQGVAGAAQDRIEGAPIAAGLVAFGAGMVLASLIPAADKEARLGARALDTVKEQAKPVVEDAKSAAADVGRSLGESAGQAAQQVKDAATEGTDRVREEGRSAAESVRDDAQA